MKRWFYQAGSSRAYVLVSMVLMALLAAISMSACKGFYPGAADNAVLKSPNDERVYEYLELENKLRVLLISDPATDKAAASLDVLVGSGDDPKDRQGLAHFLEHMLFLGTEKYPEAGEYQKFISQQGGSHNAYTSNNHTNYFFDVDSSSLDLALDRFSQFFVAPLFSSEYVTRESNAVHSEYQSKIKDDYRRQLDVLRQLFNPEHPLAKFSVGSLDTLADRPNDNVRDDLLAFYQRHYSADRMTLVVLGQESVDELKQLVISRFKDVALRETDTEVDAEPLFPSGFLPARVEVLPVKDVRSLTLMFPIPSADVFYRQKPLGYLGSILGDEGEGSLLSLLKRQGWAEGLSAGGGFGGKHEGSFAINIQLTPKGLQEQQQVIAAVFAMIEKIDQQGIEKWRFEEQANLADIAFRFAEKSKAISTVRGLADNMHYYAPQEIIAGDYLYKNFDSELVQSFLDYLRPDNVLVVVTSQDVAADKESPHFGAPYALHQASPSVGLSAKFTAGLAGQLQLPLSNPFIPTKLNLKHSESSSLKSVEQEGIELWHQYNVDFGTPKAVINIRMRSPLVSSSVEANAQAHLYAALVADALNEFSYPAALAGLHYGVSANNRGFDVSVSGYSDQQGLLLRRILGVMEKREFTPERFERLKEEFLRSWRNSLQRTPYHQLFGVMPAMLYSPYWSEEAMAEALEPVGYAQFNDFLAGLFDGAQIKMLVAGNVEEGEAAELAALVEGKLRRPQSSLLQVGAEVKNLTGVSISRHKVVPHTDNAVTFYLQAAGDGVEDEALSALLRQVLSASFYTELRTEKQLGYIVSVASMGLKSVAGSVFVVQSPATSVDEIKQAIQSFLMAQKALFERGGLEDFEQHKQALLTRLKEKPKNLKGLAGRYWYEIVDSREGEAHRQALIQSVEVFDSAAFSQAASQLLGDLNGLWLSASDTESEASVSSAGVMSQLQSYQYP